MRAVRLAFAVLLYGASSASAQTGTVFTRTGSGARAAGMANAFIAVSDDGTAASWNPAGLAQLRKLEISFVTTTAGRSQNTAGFRTRDDLSVFTPIHASYTTTYIDFASLAFPVTIAKKPVTFQAGWRRLFTLDFRDNFTTLGQPLTPQSAPTLFVKGNEDTVGGIDLLSMAGAVKLTSRVAVGGSYNVWRGDWTDDVAVSAGIADLPGPPTFGMANSTNRLRGHSAGLGLLFTYPRWSVGLTYQTPLRGEFTNVAIPSTSTDPQPPVNVSDGALRLPQSVGVGAAWRPVPGWTVDVDMTWDQWTESLLTPPGGPSVNLFDGLPPGLSATRDTLSANAGAERLFHGEGFVVPLRFGAAWEPQGPRSAYTRDPVNFAMLAAGTGYNTNSLKFDVALQYRWSHFKDGTNFGIGSPDPYQPLAVGERSLKEWRVKVSVIVRVTDTEKLHRRLRKVFGGA